MAEQGYYFEICIPDPTPLSNAKAEDLMAVICARFLPADTIIEFRLRELDYMDESAAFRAKTAVTMETIGHMHELYYELFYADAWVQQQGWSHFDMFPDSYFAPPEAPIHHPDATQSA